MTDGAPLLQIKDLSTRFETPEGPVYAINKVNLTIKPGECLGIVGESGSGKSQTFLTVYGLLAENAVTEGSVQFQGEELLKASKSRLNALRGDKMGMIFQDSITGLTPHMKVGKQMMEVLVEHRGLTPQQAEKEVLDMMEIVQIPDAASRFHLYPHEFSGGMRQRIMIAQALLCRPALLVADEPTTALDVTVQASILRLFRKLKEHTNMSIVIISHDLGVVAGLADRVAVMYGGSLVEVADVDDLFVAPAHPYSRGLLASVPSLDAELADELPTIPGQPPNLRQQLPGCVFAARCPDVMDRCRTSKPVRRDIASAHEVACHKEFAQ